ncbi:MAG: hypothetical protein BWY92_01764 [Firmicutes bacterium ADurb.BinA052]|nr:MAG: hypothetical protein BWY92_01764 [Firmicutes bacterium ADurb.BinA052]
MPFPKAPSMLGRQPESYSSKNVADDTASRCMTRYGDRSLLATGELAAATPAAGQRADHRNAHTTTRAATRELAESLERFPTFVGHDTSILTFPARAGVHRYRILVTILA